jgi:hypothetical protein
MSTIGFFRGSFWAFGPDPPDLRACLIRKFRMVLPADCAEIAQKSASQGGRGGAGAAINNDVTLSSNLS